MIKKSKHIDITRHQSTKSQQDKKQGIMQNKTIRKQQNGKSKFIFSIITLNINGFYFPIKRHRMAEWIKKQDTKKCCLQETHFSLEDAQRLRVKR